MKRAWLLMALVAFGCDDQPDDPKPDRAVVDALVDVVTGDLGGDDLGRSDMARPDMARPDMAPTDDGVPVDMARPDMARPDMAPGDDGPPDEGAPVDMAVPDEGAPADEGAPLDEGTPADEGVADMRVEPDMAPPLPDMGPGPLAVRLTAPVDGALVAASPIDVRGRVVLPVDALTVSGLPVVPGADGSFVVAVPLVEGPNTVTAVATRGDERAEASAGVTLDTIAPVIGFTSPVDGAVTADVRVSTTGTIDDPTASVAVNGVAAAVADGAFRVEVALVEGENTLTAVARDPAGNEARVSVRIIRDSAAPAVAITAPIDGLVTAAESIEVRGTVGAGATVRVNGVDAAVAAGVFTATVPLAEGRNVLTAVARDAAGNQAQATVNVTRDRTPPVVAITAPLDGAVIGTPSVRVRGTVDDRAATVTVNGLPAVVLANGTFAVDLPLGEGQNVITATARDALGNEAQARVTVLRDNGAPVVVIEAPVEGFVTNAPVVEVTGTVDDPAASVEVSGVAAVVAGGRFSATVALAEGENVLVATARDAVGNEGTDQVTVLRDLRPPVVAIGAPRDGAIIGAASVVVSGTVDDAAATVMVNGLPAPVAAGAFSVEVPLVEGQNGIAAVARDAAGNEATAAITVLRDTTAPVVMIQVPADGARLIRRTVRATGTVNDATAGVVVNGVEAALNNGRWVVDLELVEGDNTVEAVATDRAGNTARASVAVVVDSTPAGIVITEPADGFETGDDTITVRGRVEGEDVAVVEIDGIAVPVAPDGSFERDGIALEEGANVITATVTDAFGNVGLARVEVIRDAGAPVIHIETPADGDILTTTQVDVAGITNDYITGITVGEDDLDVWVNGQPAMVLNRTFSISDLLLQRGPNTITVEAEDRAGNRSSKSIQVTVVDEAGQRLVLISGQSQGARQGESLRDPLTVSLLDENGNPVPGAPVTFTVTKGDGALEAFPETGRTLVVETDDNGLASVGFTPGGRAGAGSHRVRASAEGFLGAVEFCTSVYPDAAVQVVAVEGENQMGQLATRLPAPMVALVTDPAGNPVLGVPVTFTVLGGGGAFDGEAEVVVESDGDGLARATLTLGAEPGRNSVRATIAALEDPEAQGAVWHAEAFAAGDRASTRVVGQVLDNQDNPIPGVTAYIRLEDGPVIAAETDAEGMFAIEDAPVGAVHLVIEGSTAARDGEWPSLTYDIITVAGVDNDLGKPVYLPELAPENTAMVGGDEDVTLTMEGVPGATLTVFANSVTCIDGARQCEIVWSQVRGERVPDPAPMGSTFDMVATLQPPGVRMDPPARVCIPNRGNPPGYQQEMFAYDHDLGDWVGIGTGSVTADGQQICTDTGFGLHKSGWHGAPPPPPPPRCPSNCDNGNPCQTGRCVEGSCQYEPKGDGTRCDDGSGCGEAVCQGGSCVFQSQEADGTACDDNDQCTQSSECQGGACVGSDPLDCDDGEDCTDDSCDPLQGCQNPPKGEGATCTPAGGAPADACIEKHVCEGGACTPKEKECEDLKKECVENTCENGDCVEKPKDEGQPCGEEGEECGQYQCKAGECAPADGQENTDDQECDDESECTEDDRCQNGECKGDKRDINKVEGGVQFNFSRDIEAVANRMEALINRVPFLSANFGTGGAFSLKGSREDCCKDATGEFIEFGKRSLTGQFQVGASIAGTLPGLGFLDSFEERVGNNRVAWNIRVGIIADIGLTLSGSAGYTQDECLNGEDGCVTLEGKLELSGGLSATFSVEACVEVGIFGVSVCPNLTITPARIVATASGQCAARFGNCGNDPACSFTFGQLKFVAEINYIFDVFTYERVLYGGL